MDIEKRVQIVSRLVQIGEELNELAETPANERVEMLMAQRHRLQREVRNDAGPADVSVQTI